MHFTEQRLTLRSASSQREESERAPGEGDLGPDEALSRGIEPGKGLALRERSDEVPTPQSE